MIESTSSGFGTCAYCRRPITGSVIHVARTRRIPQENGTELLISGPEFDAYHSRCWDFHPDSVSRPVQT
jgi:hypothetical protein